jgi:hypothetical protein
MKRPDPLSDDQLTWLLKNRVLSHNGFRCSRVLIENGVPSTRHVCEAISTVQGGTLKVHATCGEPCSFVCKNTYELQQELERIQFYQRIIDEARNP